MLPHKNGHIRVLYDHFCRLGFRPDLLEEEDSLAVIGIADGGMALTIAFITWVVTFALSLSMRLGYNGMLGCVAEVDRGTNAITTKPDHVPIAAWRGHGSAAQGGLVDGRVSRPVPHGAGSLAASARPEPRAQEDEQGRAGLRHLERGPVVGRLGSLHVIRAACTASCVPVVAALCAVASARRNSRGV